MATATVAPSWSVVAADAVRHREQVLEHVRQWGAALHVARRALPSRWVAAWDIAARPHRLRIVGADTCSTDRDRAEAAADDLWDAVATTWALVRWVAITRHDGVPGVEHVVAELHAAGRWLSHYPVIVAAHDHAIDGLFGGPAEATSCDR